ncbi:MAG: hypothetical protein NTW61_08670 [Candidatus Melainabacteria bacterium]|nr:hypothetical protein [Candidatus Melainabacteria bacterium]
MMMTSISPSANFQYLQAKDDKTWSGGSIVGSTEARINEVDTDHDGQISLQEAKASGGLFGQGNFDLNSNSANMTAIWKHIAGDDGKMSKEELASLFLYADSQGGGKMDGVITAEESNNVMADLAKAPVETDLHGVIWANAQDYNLSKFIADTGEQKRIDAKRLATLQTDKTDTQGLVNQAQKATEEANGVPQQIGQPNILATLIKTCLSMLPMLFNQGNNQQQQAVLPQAQGVDPALLQALAQQQQALTAQVPQAQGVDPALLQALAQRQQALTAQYPQTQVPSITNPYGMGAVSSSLPQYPTQALSQSMPVLPQQYPQYPPQAMNPQYPTQRATTSSWPPVTAPQQRFPQRSQSFANQSSVAMPQQRFVPQQQQQQRVATHRGF